MFSHFFVHGVGASWCRQPGLGRWNASAFEGQMGMASYGCSMLEPWEPAGHFSIKPKTPALRVDDSDA